VSRCDRRDSQAKAAGPYGGEEAPILDIPRIGEIAALCTAMVWAFTAIFFSLASDRVGALAVNRTRLVFAVLLLGLSHWAVFGSPLPLEASTLSWMWLGLSGLIGLTLGDSFLFQALVDLGPRKAMLIMASWPIFSSLMGFAFLGEKLSWLELAGVAATLAGIAWVVLERNSPSMARKERLGRGVAFAFGAAVCQAAGIVAAKEGLQGGLTSLAGTLIRMIVATAGILVVTLLMGGVRESLGKLKDRRALLFTTCGAVTGPFIGVWLSLFAVHHAKVGIASALMALVPVLLLPLMWLAFRERVSPRALWGTLAAFAGVVILLIE
jgi:drug/metabolite transporter (DMT)-like permease